jgi:predicted Rossmann fold nucleotide-binding protein DprA/Smf involved in DNA uptake
VEEDEIFKYSVILVCLFLDSPRFPNSLHPNQTERVLKLLATQPASYVQASVELDKNGGWEASARLYLDGIIAWAERLVERKEVVTLVQPEYPGALLARLGPDAPPVLWRSGLLPSGRFASIRGSRSAPESAYEFARRAGEATARAGFALVTGGGSGCEWEAESGALEAGGSVIRVLSHRPQYEPTVEQICELSVHYAETPMASSFSRETNRLIESLSDQNLFAHACIRAGHSWQSAIDCIRRKLSPAVVPSRQRESWSQALIALGAIELSSPSEFPASGATNVLAARREI